MTQEAGQLTQTVLHCITGLWLRDAIANTIKIIQNNEDLTGCLCEHLLVIKYKQ